MFLSDRDIGWAIRHRHLLIIPNPAEGDIGPTSIDLHLDKVEEVKIWNIPLFRQQNKTLGHGDFPELNIGSFDYKEFVGKFQTVPPSFKRSDEAGEKVLVFRRGEEIIVRPGGFVLWQTKERVGTPEEGAQLICFVDGKSTKARTGLVVHMTAPTIHAGWGAWPVTLEIANHGPFHLVLKEDDAVAQLTVAKISSVPERTMRQAGSVTVGQPGVGMGPSPAQ